MSAVSDSPAMRAALEAIERLNRKRFLPPREPPAAKEHPADAMGLLSVLGLICADDRKLMIRTGD